MSRMQRDFKTIDILCIGQTQQGRHSKNPLK
uniref:Uncharacterized protein n=1 Tax=Anguilla anguilla TaxID=7936 RepID=A0A0E9QBL7_ANGAN